MNNFRYLSKKKAEYVALVMLYPLIILFAQLGKVCKLFGTKKRQITASVLSVAMILTMLPVMSLTAFAANLTPTPLTFTAKEDNSSVTLNYNSGTDVMYKKINGDWVAYTKGDEIQLNKNDTVSFKGTQVTTDDENHFAMTGKIAASGDVTSLTNGTGGNAVLRDHCYISMFNNCISLTTAPALPATTLSKSCYSNMFNRCTSLTSPPELPATTMTNFCYRSMFEGCRNLTSPPKLPATTLASYCYDKMFFGCINLTTPPDLPATKLASYCYEYMFGHTSLTTAPELPATALSESCYSNMFNGCSRLTAAPALPATTMTDFCYRSMFEGCRNLTSPPKLPATTLANYCYDKMFFDCVSIRISKTKVGNYTKEWRIPTKETITTWAINWSHDMFLRTRGTFTGNPELNTTYYIYEEPTPLTFTAEENNSSVTLKYISGTDVMYKLGNANWATYTKGSAIKLNKNESVIFKGTNVITDLDNHFSMAGKIAATGDVTSLTNGTGGDVTLTDYCYKYIFYGCTSLTVAPELPTTAMAYRCYYSMFKDCTSLTVAPELPATTLADYCYRSMFYGCTSLKVSATKVGDYTKEWRIPATGTITTTARNWNANMLYGTRGTFTGNPELNTTYYIYKDCTPPVVLGIENGKTYCGTAEFTITDDSLDTVKINGNTVTALNGKYTLTATGTNTVIANDKAGNITTITVTINVNHTYDNTCDTTCNVCGKTRTVTHNWKTEWSSDSTNHWHECSICGEKNDIAEHKTEVDDGDCTTPVRCTVCNAVITPTEHSNDFTEEIDKLPPFITEDENGSYQNGSKDSLSFKSNMSLADFENVSVDGSIINKSKPNDTQSPQTGNTSNIILWIALLLVSGGALTAFRINKKRKKSSAE